MNLSIEFDALISREGATESDVLRFLKQYPGLMRRLFCHSNNYWAVLSEFKLGSEYRTDFVVLSANSGSWQAVFIECEGPKDQIYLKNGQPAKKLRAAQKQIRQWQAFVNANQSTVRLELAKCIKPFKVHAQNFLMGKGGMTADLEIKASETPVHFYYRIMMGRRSTFNFNVADHLCYPGTGYREEVSTYDRALDSLRVFEEETTTDLREFLIYGDRFTLARRPRE